MAQYPSLPLWTDAYLADTTHLTTLEHGAYLLLLMAMWRAGGTLPNDDKQLARFARLTTGQWARIKPTIFAFFRVSSDSITQGRLTDELGYVRQQSRKQSDRANARWLKNNNSTDATALPDACRDDAETMPDGCPHTHTHSVEANASTPMSETGSDDRRKAPKKQTYLEDFEAFWSAYPRSPNMSKPKALAAWKKLGTEDRDDCRRAVARYRSFLASKPDHPTMHASTFINERRFDGFNEQVEPVASRPASDDDWRKRLTYARTNRKWHVEAWGPLPRSEGCHAPEHLLQPEDGQGWAVWES